MHARLFPLIPLLPALISACGAPPPVTSVPEARPPTPPARASAPSAKLPEKLDAIPRLEFNRLAAERALPLFWIADENGSGSIDADEVAILWGVSPSKKDAWVDWMPSTSGFYPNTPLSKYRFTLAFFSAYEAMLKHRAEGADGKAAGLSAAEQKRRALVRQELAQGLPSLVRTDLRSASAEDKALVAHVLKVAEIVERIYAKQTGTEGMAAEIPADDPASRMLFYRNQGPWCRAPLTEKNPECNALARKPAHLSGLYPASVQKDPKFCEALGARKDHAALLDTFSVVAEIGGELKPVPYNVAYKPEMEAISRELKAAAEAIKSPEEAALKAYLVAAAQSFLDNNWVPADEAWARMNATNSRYFLRVAPDETYFEPCSLHAGFHVSFARINQESLVWQKKLEPVKLQMEAELAKLAGAPYKARKVAFHLPDFIDVVLNAGDARNPLGATIGQSLPNVGPVASEGRGRTVAMTNLYTDKDNEEVFYQQTKSVFCEGTMPLIRFDPKQSTMSTVLHEAAHNLGPAHDYKVGGKVDHDVFGGPLASTLEELKAQTSALYLADFLAEKGILEKSVAQMAHARDVAWAFNHIAQGMYAADGTPKPYSQLASIQMGFFLKAGALAWKADMTAANGKDKGCFEIHLAKFPAAIVDLERQVLGIKAKADKAAALKLREEFVDKDNEWKKHRGILQERFLRTPKASFVYAVEM